MRTVNTHEAKTHLSRLLAAVEAGETILIARAGRPVARLGPIEVLPEGRVLGQDRDLFQVPDDFDAPLPDELLEAFER